MIKLIVSDLDGTLLNDALNVPEDFFSLAERLFEKNIMFAIATGRSQTSIQEKFNCILKNLYSISDNGSLIRKGEEELLCKTINFDYIKSIIAIGRSIENAWPVLCGKDAWYIENTDKPFLDKVHLYTRNYHVVNDLTQVDVPIIKVSLCDINGAEQNSLKHYRIFEQELKVAVGGTLWLDITMQDANKGMAVEYLQELHGISKNETLVFGDMLNDLEMMQTASHSYAMKNAHPKLKEVANFITDKDNNEQGVIDMIEKLCLM
jgi:Cof subfamily protein (haloacid dehalogenase superfamily)